jgi:superfamily I DNA and/or RNA helicase
LFSSPFAFVDTSSLPPGERAERSHRGIKGGTDNPAEALLLGNLAAFYHQRGTEWALIVPYTAQVKLIRENLAGLIPDPDVIESNVGTVDAFQGGERDVVLYGFTRSNPGGLVGFLDELRRANVAFTRAKQQLVLVGDMRTLLRAQNTRFHVLATALRDYVREHGDVRHYREIMALLAGQERVT